MANYGNKELYSNQKPETSSTRQGDTTALIDIEVSTRSFVAKSLESRNRICKQRQLRVHVLLLICYVETDYSFSKSEVIVVYSLSNFPGSRICTMSCSSIKNNNVRTVL